MSQSNQNSPEEIKELLRPVANEELFPTSDPVIFHTAWKPMGKVGERCLVYTWKDQPIGTAAIRVNGDGMSQEQMLADAVKRIQDHLAAV